MNDEKNKQDSKIFVRIDLDTAVKLAELTTNEIEPDLIKKVIDHALVCNKWHLDQKKALV